MEYMYMIDLCIELFDEGGRSLVAKLADPNPGWVNNVINVIDGRGIDC